MQEVLTKQLVEIAKKKKKNKGLFRGSERIPKTSDQDKKNPQRS